MAPAWCLNATFKGEKLILNNFQPEEKPNVIPHRMTCHFTWNAKSTQPTNPESQYTG